MNAGIPETVRRLTLTFRYNDIASVEDLFARNRGKIAGLIFEAARADDPKDGFLHEVHRLCRENGALLILDEMITGFRWHAGGAQKLYGIEPDLSCFGKALANGFSVSALAGKREYMRLGGLEHTDRPRLFLLSTTHDAETHSLAAAITTMRIYRDEPVIEHLYLQGAKLSEGIEDAARRHGVFDHVKLAGPPCCLAFTTLDTGKQQSQAFRSLFLQETIRRGVLMPSLVVSYTQTTTKRSHGPSRPSTGRWLSMPGRSTAAPNDSLSAVPRSWFFAASIAPTSRRKSFRSPSTRKRWWSGKPTTSKEVCDESSGHRPSRLYRFGDGSDAFAGGSHRNRL